MNTLTVKATTLAIDHKRSTIAALLAMAMVVLAKDCGGAI